MSNDKVITYDTCDKCKAIIAAGVTLIPDTKQQLREALAREAYLKAQIKQLTDELEKNNER
jgi:hypothetical protein